MSTMAGRSRVARVALYREVDVSRVSGCGVIADGAVWDDGSAVIYWRGTTSGIRQHESFRHWSEIEAIHGHGGRTRLVWIDPPPA
ncbi:hypothetical protein Afil01_29820 [Actinorhabdospora filicis]|uniref:Uncharacterized protein n=1 Tax=Actinorhabdospora filicis TaxID=1785913 RepID=A0A9W6SJG1_9ACTN|nr:hypothetical protein [Actinorhabdospora filicis]GLZ78175.1 hypothetical protein Afil01_29820 [Actinorhabdospora filicis]